MPDQDKIQNQQPIEEQNETKQPIDVPDEELDAVAGGWGHDRYYHWHGGRRGYWRNGTFIELNL